MYMLFGRLRGLNGTRKHNIFALSDYLHFLRQLYYPWTTGCDSSNNMCSISLALAVSLTLAVLRLHFFPPPIFLVLLKLYFSQYFPYIKFKNRNYLMQHQHKTHNLTHTFAHEIDFAFLDFFSLCFFFQFIYITLCPWYLCFLCRYFRQAERNSISSRRNAKRAVVKCSQVAHWAFFSIGRHNETSTLWYADIDLFSLPPLSFSLNWIKSALLMKQTISCFLSKRSLRWWIAKITMEMICTRKNQIAYTK